MVFCALITISLDISTNIAWWIITTSCKYTLHGTYHLITIIKPQKPQKEEIELMELNELCKLNNTLYIMHNNSGIINRNQLMFKNTLNENLYNVSDDTFDLYLLDDFVIINDNNLHGVS